MSKKKEEPENAEELRSLAQHMAKRKIDEATKASEEWFVVFKKEWGFE